LMALNMPIISVLFQRRAFDVHAATLTAQALFCYALGLWAFSVLRVITAAFYSLQDAKWPMKAAVITLLVNLGASVALMYPLKHNGLALANSIAAIVNVVVLSIVLKNKIGAFLDRQFYLSVGKIIISSLAMWGAIMLIDFVLPWSSNGQFRARLVYLIVAVITGAMTYFICAYLLKSPEIHSIIGQVKKRLKR